MKLKIKAFDAVPTRFVVGLMIFFGHWISNMYRVNISLNIIAMVPEKVNITTVKSECAALVANQSFSYEEVESQMLQRKVEDSVKYDWSAQEQAHIISGFFWGFFVTGLFAGPLVELCGPRNLVFGSVLLSALLTMFSPQMAKIHFGALVVNRVFIGLATGVHFPAFHSLIARWAPPDEKGLFVGAIVGGGLGTVATWSFTGPLIENFGWEYAFYVQGLIAMVLCLLFWFLVYDSPLAHPRINAIEKDYILNSIGDKLAHRSVKVMPPLRSMLTSGPFLAMIILHYGNAWGFYFGMTAAPKYVSTALGYNLSATGFLSSLPYLARITTSLIFGVIGDRIVRKKLMSTTAIRKFFCIFSHVIPGILLVCLSYAGCSPMLSVAIITTALGSNGAATLTNLVNPHDLAPNFASSLTGIASAIGSIAGFTTPYITAYYTKDGNGIADWRPVFTVGSSVYIASAVYFAIFGTSKTQKWNHIREDVQKDGKQKELN